MRVDSALIKKLRAAKPWTQDQLAEACGLDLRTIQRIESNGRASSESVRALAAVFEVDPNELTLIKEDDLSAFEAFKIGLIKYSDFSGTATRFEYWWFLLFALLISAAAATISDTVLQIVSLILLLPLLAAGSRRLHDIDQSGWWQLLFLAPFGFIPVFVMLALESDGKTSQQANDCPS
jgi:transcriptional regulator with XRE-family HTH domain